MASPIVSLIDTIGLRTTEESCPSDSSTAVITLSNFSHHLTHTAITLISHMCLVLQPTDMPRHECYGIVHVCVCVWCVCVSACLHIAIYCTYICTIRVCHLLHCYQATTPCAPLITSVGPPQLHVHSHHLSTTTPCVCHTTHCPADVPEWLLVCAHESDRTVQLWRPGN